MTRVRVCLHAMDRTGPPMLALALVRWLLAQPDSHQVDIVSFRGGPLADDAADIVPTHVLLDDSEAWDHTSPDPSRRAALADRLASMSRPDVVLLVSVAAGQVLAVHQWDAPVVTWVVEMGEDLHWLDPPVDVAAMTSCWMAGATVVRSELDGRLPAGTHVELVAEFIERPAPDGEGIRAAKHEMAPGGQRTVVAAGIGTFRKAPDLFLEIAAAHGRAFGDGTRFVWIGGESDDLLPRCRAEADRLGLDSLCFVDSVADMDNWLAAADVMLHPARFDAFPLVCLHAAALGTPVLAFRGSGGTEEMFADCFVGVPYPDVEAMAALVDQALQGDLVTVGQTERVLSHYTSNTAAAEVAKVLHAAAATVRLR